MQRIFALLLALLLAFPFPAYAGSTPSDADVQYLDYNNFDISNDFSVTPRSFGYISFRPYVNWRTNINDPNTSAYELIEKRPDGLYYWYQDRAWIKNLDLVFRPVEMPKEDRWYLMTFRLPPGNVGWFHFILTCSFQFRYWDPDQSKWLIQSLTLTAPDFYESSSNHNLYAQFYLKYNVPPEEMVWTLNVTTNPGGGLLQRLDEVDFLPMIVSSTLATEQDVANTSLKKLDLKSPLVSDNDTIDNISDKVDNIASSVQQLPGKIQSVTNAVKDVVQGIANLPQNIAGALEPHYDNILQQLHHITEQLHALWDQLAAYFNDKLIPQMITDTNRIVEAIEAINLEVNVDFDALKQQLAQQHKEQMDNDNKNTEEIVNGYENGDMDSISGQFGDAATNSDNAEDQLINSVSGNISDFTFDPDIMFEYIEAIDDVAQIMSYFLRLSIIKTPLVFMLTLSIALLMIGYYRFKGGG